MNTNHPPPTTPQDGTGLQKIASATAILLFAQIAGALLQLLSLRTVQDTLSKAGNGEFFWIQQLGTFVFFTFVEMGMVSIATRMVVHEPERQDHIIGTLFRLRMMLWSAASLLLCLVCVAFVPALLGNVILYAVFSLIGARSLLLRPLLEIRWRARNRQFLPAMTGLLDAACFAALVLYDAPSLTPERVIVWMLLSALPGLCIMLLAHNQWRSILRERFDSETARHMLRESMPLLLSLLLMQAQDKLDTFILDIAHGKEAVGVYGAAVRLHTQSITVLMILPVVLAPAVSALLQRDVENCKRYMLQGFKITLLLALVAGAVVSVSAEPIILLTAGKKYLHHRVEFVLAAWSIAGSITVAYILALLTAVGWQRALLPMMWTLASASLLFNLALTPSFGALGAVCAKLLTSFTGACVGLYAMQQFLGGNALRQLLLRALAVAVSAIACAEGLRSAMHAFALTEIWQSAFAGCCIALFVAGGCTATNLVSRQELALLRSIRKQG